MIQANMHKSKQAKQKESEVFTELPVSEMPVWQLLAMRN